MKYDLLIYFRDNLIASSGGVGDWMDVSFIPSFLGEKLVDRVKAWQAYKKNGLALINSKWKCGDKFNLKLIISSYEI